METATGKSHVSIFSSSVWLSPFLAFSVLVLSHYLAHPNKHSLADKIPSLSRAPRGSAANDHPYSKSVPSPSASEYDLLFLQPACLCGNVEVLQSRKMQEDASGPRNREHI